MSRWRCFTLLAGLVSACTSAPPKPFDAPVTASSASMAASPAAPPQPPTSASALATGQPSSGQADCLAPLREVEIVVAAKNATTFTTDGKDLFWSDGHAIFKRAVAGGEPVELIRDAAPSAYVNQLEVDGDQVFFAAAKDFARGCLGLVGFVPRKGGPASKVGPAGCAEGLSLTQDRVLFVQRSVSTGGGELFSTLYSAPREKNAKPIVLKRNFIGLGQVSAAAGFAYFADNVGTLSRIPIMDGATEPIVGRNGIDGVDNARFAADGEHVYFLFGHLNFNGLRLARVPAAGGEQLDLGAALPVTPDGQGYPRGRLRLSETHVHWTHPATGTVFRVTKTGKCAVETLAKGRTGPDWVMPGGPFIYWLEASGVGAQVARVKVRDR